jgi:Arc/MetJ-type ribon-helix-helix transcriptional regulator
MSTTNKRTVVYLPPALAQWVEQEAAKNYESVCDVIRRAIVAAKESVQPCKA